ncbi:MAG TPA: FAD-dependent oxidoreductase [Vicinamibacterales bacterium]
MQTTATKPYWSDSASLPRFPKIDTDEQCDVLVVGGGMTGLTAAYLLSSAGKSVVVLERRRLAEIDTGHTSAHVTMITDLRLTELQKTFGRDHAQAVWDAGVAAMSHIDETIREQEIACDFAWVPGYLHLPWQAGRAASTSADRASVDKQVKDFQDEAALAREMGFDATSVEDVPLVGGPGVRFDDQARFNPRKYLSGLVRALSDRGVKIYEHSDAGEFTEKPLGVKVNGVTVTCGDVVLATHTPLTGIKGIVGASVFQTKLALYTSYVVAGRIDAGTVPDALFWDTADPYRYLRLEAHRDFDVVILGGEDHKTGQVEDTGECYERLESALEALVPGIELTHRWSGQVVETPDGLPYIGWNAEHQFAATGYSGNGMTFGTLAGMMAADAILGRTNPWTELFEPTRTKIRGGAWDYIKENADYPYYMIRDLLTRARARKPTCTHMGCAVNWNVAERTWDCPCHGSRFKPNGTVISGPAESPLEGVK